MPGSVYTAFQTPKSFKPVLTALKSHGAWKYNAWLDWHSPSYLAGVEPFMGLEQDP